MRDRLPAYFQLQKYDITPEDIVKTCLGCDSDAVKPRVIVTPGWQASTFEKHASSIATVSEGIVYEIEYHGLPITFIRSGIGAPQTGDFILALGCTACERVIFTGSVGGLEATMEMGDFIISEKSLCGDGFSRYLDADIHTKDCFLHPVEPDLRLTESIRNCTCELCQEESVPLHCGTIFSTDSVIAQFFRVDYLVENFDCIGIEMETSAVFKAARLVGIRAGALLQVSDVIPRNKSLFSGRTKVERERRHHIRETILTKAILDSMIDDDVRAM